MTTYTIGPSEQRNIHLSESGEYRVELTGEGAEAHISGSFATKDRETVEITLTIVHQSGHTRANTILKGAASDQSRIRFFGRIVIEESCPDTQSFLEERILLLSDGAKAEAVPELEIKSDDVKCSHAASISRIPEEHLFYLESRGIPKAIAQEMIVSGFLATQYVEPEGLQE